MCIGAASFRCTHMFFQLITRLCCMYLLKHLRSSGIIKFIIFNEIVSIRFYTNGNLIYDETWNLTLLFCTTMNVFCRCSTQEMKFYETVWISTIPVVNQCVKKWCTFVRNLIGSIKFLRCPFYLALIILINITKRHVWFERNCCVATVSVNGLNA